MWLVELCGWKVDLRLCRCCVAGGKSAAAEAHFVRRHEGQGVLAVKLSDLGQFTIASREHSERGWVLRGSFNHLDTVREGRSWLYVSRHN